MVVLCHGIGLECFLRKLINIERIMLPCYLKKTQIATLVRIEVFGVDLILRRKDGVEPSMEIVKYASK